MDSNHFLIKIIRKRVLCLVARCTTPPIPEDEYNLELIWNPDYAPLIGESVKYSCAAAGKFNRIEDDFGLADYYLECLEGGDFEIPDW